MRMGNLYLDAPLDKLSESILQFAGCDAEGMQHALLESRDHSQHFLRKTWKISSHLIMAAFSPSVNQFPLPDYPIGVDWSR